MTFFFPTICVTSSLSNLCWNVNPGCLGTSAEMNHSKIWDCFCSSAENKFDSLSISYVITNINIVLYIKTQQWALQQDHIKINLAHALCLGLTCYVLNCQTKKPFHFCPNWEICNWGIWQSSTALCTVCQVP